jgi:hypothetical protein
VSVTAVRAFSMSTPLDASTVTPGSTAPDVSRTSPAMVAWAKAVEGMTATAAQRSQRNDRRHVRIRLPPIDTTFRYPKNLS